jgi:hypothetical protein
MASPLGPFGRLARVECRGARPPLRGDGAEINPALTNV